MALNTGVLWPSLVSQTLSGTGQTTMTALRTSNGLYIAYVARPINHYARLELASYPGSSGEGKEPGTHRLRMRVITPTFWGSGRILTAHVCDTMTQLHSEPRYLAVERSVSYALEKIARSSVVLKSEQATCMECIYKEKDVKYAVRVRAPTDDVYVPLVKFYVNCPRLLQ